MLAYYSSALSCYVGFQNNVALEKILLYECDFS